MLFPTLYPGWVTLSEQDWATLGKRRGGSDAGIFECIHEGFKIDYGNSMSMPIKHSPIKCALIGIAAALAVLGTAFLVWERVGPRAVTVTSGQFPEELVYIRSTDDMMNSGAMFRVPEHM